MNVKNGSWQAAIKIMFAVTAVALMTSCTSAKQSEPPAATESSSVADDVVVVTAVAQPTALSPATPVPTATVAPIAPTIDLPDLGPAPEINNEIWLNSPEPVTLASVHGQKALLLEFWTFG